MILAALCAIFLFAGCGSSSYLETKSPAVSCGGNEAAGPEGTEEPKLSDSSEEGNAISSDESKRNVYVQVAGAVAKPDVYRLPEGSRIFEAISCAGGFLADAYDKDLNLAEVVKDGQKIYIPTEEEHLSDKGSEQDDGRININTADEAALMTLPGIGEAKARLIIRYREEHGGFSSTEQLREVEGIKEGTYQKICEHIKI